MGKTSFSGPVYGAKATLASAHYNTCSTALVSTLVMGSVIVPVGEDWYATEVSWYRGSTGSTALVLYVRDDGTDVSSKAMTSSLAHNNAITIVTPDGGEYEGKRIASGSTVTFEYGNSTSSIDGSSNVMVTLYGFRRFVSSTRAE